MPTTSVTRRREPRRMQRIPKLAAVPIAVAALVALLAASAATGRSQEAPQNTKEPVIASPYLVVVGTNLSGEKGTWTGTDPITYTYQWKRCDDNGEKCTRHQRREQDLVHRQDGGRGKDDQVPGRRQEQGRQGPGRVGSDCDDPQEPEGPDRGAARPTVSGTATVGEKLTATDGSWQGTQPISTTIRWQTCNAAGHELYGERRVRPGLHRRQVGRGQAPAREGASPRTASVRRRLSPTPPRSRRTRAAEAAEAAAARTRFPSRTSGRPVSGWSSTRSFSTRTRSRPGTCRSR